MASTAHLTTASPKTCQVVLANNIAKGLLAEVKEDLKNLRREIKIVGFLATEDEGSKMYAEWSETTCKEK